jgi:hypothetical protein
MRTTGLITAYAGAALFSALGVRALVAWRRERDQRAGHLAVATLLYGAQSLLSAISTTLWNSLQNEQPPRFYSVIQSSLLYIAVFFFLWFLFDFVKLPSFLLWVFGVATIVFIVLSAVEHAVIKVDPVTKVIVSLKGSPIDVGTFLNIVILYLAIVFGILWIAFAVYGFRLRGLARFRMLSIAAGFFLIFVVLGLIPRLLRTGQKLEGPYIQTIQYMALAAAPLLFLGFTPPQFISRRFAGRS